MFRIMIITRDYEEVVEALIEKAQGIQLVDQLSGTRNIRRSRDSASIKGDFLKIDIYNYRGGGANRFRGNKADLIYLEEELYDDNETREMIFKPMAPWGAVKPLSILRMKLGWR